MVRPTLVLAATFLVLILVLSSLASHVQAFIANGFQLSSVQMAFPAVVFPISATRGGGISIPLIIAAGLAGALHSFLFRRFVVKRWRWVTEEEYARLLGSK